MCVSKLERPGRRDASIVTTWTVTESSVEKRWAFTIHTIQVRTCACVRIYGSNEGLFKRVGGNLVRYTGMLEADWRNAVGTR